ncbi:glycosyltransferase family 4 protein [Paenibacillus glycinis]|uniref:Glycosyltransferase n=1 Tax=Paenibacillus glycinis TaxID=2697035 RepID=A0ABW9XLV7_9BACL|nr:glycosyltransferase family 4 protein [Paenibacillus glycinis]NBD23608.1 glycosyltransferase [Paenibacillus glycinis]
MKRRIVFVINYFYPDFASTGQLMTTLCLHLQNEFDITVIAAQPDNVEDDLEKRTKLFTKDMLEGVQIIRIRMPAVDKTNKFSRMKYISTYFLLALFVVLRQRRTNIIYTISSPPIIGGLIGTIGKVLKRAKHVYNIQDFNPEQAEAVSFLKQSWVFRVAKWIDNWNCKMADHIVTVGRDMQETLTNRFSGRNGKIPSNTVINNWAEENEIVPLPKEHPNVERFLAANNLKGKFIIMYSGNLGLYYDLENIIQLTSRFKDHPDIAFVFIGDGAVKDRMKQFVLREKIENVLFLPFQPKEYIKYSLNAADVHLVVNQKGIKGVSVPSKIYGVMASGKPILGVLESGSEACRLIVDSNSGVVVEPRDYDGIYAAIMMLYNMGEHHLQAAGLQGRRYLESNLKKEISLEKYRYLLQSL